VSGWSRRVVGAAVAGLCVLGVLGAGTPAMAKDVPSSAKGVACGTLDLYAGGIGDPATTTAVLGSTSATLDGTITDALFARGLANPTLVIRDGDKTLRSGPVDVPAGWQDPSTAILPDSIVRLPAPSPDGRDPVVPLCVVRFAHSPHPTVLLGLFTGGAHCCTVLRAYPLTSHGSGAAVDQQIGNPGVDVRGHGNRTIVVTADDAFNYEFNAYAFSGVPIKVLEFRKGEFADTTRHYRTLIRTDADQWWKSFEADPSEGLGSLAAWAADQCLLHKGAGAWATIDRLLAEGKLAGSPDNAGLWPAGADYVAKLHTFLPGHGYCR
jgi:hypothetical protein